MRVTKIGEIYNVFRLENTVESFLKCGRILEENNYKPIRSLREYYK